LFEVGISNVHVQCDVVNCYRPIGFFIVTYDVCLKWEFPWSYMYAQVGLLVHGEIKQTQLGITCIASIQYHTQYISINIHSTKYQHNYKKKHILYAKFPLQ
jgi:hypothetical protein